MGEHDYLEPVVGHVPGEVPVDVHHRAPEVLPVAAHRQLGARVGRDIRIDARVDPAILGGVVVRLGSQMIDASIRTKLNTLATAMKG